MKILEQKCYNCIYFGRNRAYRDYSLRLRGPCLWNRKDKEIPEVLKFDADPFIYHDLGTNCAVFVQISEE